jgi:hypothetical protein
MLTLGALTAARPAVVLAQGRVDSPHGSLATPCEQCHSANAWKPVKISTVFSHPSRFALEGAHARTTCTSCHRTLVFANVPTTCVGCHTDVHRGELGADCSRCHTPRSFIDRAAMVRAHQTSRFPLTGVHAVADCVSCHAPTAQGQMQFVNRPTQCESCHLAEASIVKNPDHQAAGFTRQCERCHSPTVWTRARFDHATTAFPLTGAHVRATCEQCHSDRVYNGKPTDCVSCHRADYDKTVNPAHVAASFPTTCATCHATATWTGARFDHDGPYFPIYSGAHRGRWSSCSSCHTSASSYKAFTCLTCHSQTETDGHHRSISGYRYDSQTCYTCHRSGKSP